MPCSLSIWDVESNEGAVVDISLAELDRSWASVLYEGSRTKAMHKAECICPPLGTFKLNFNGSFLWSTRQGGIGGVIRNLNGNVVRM